MKSSKRKTNPVSGYNWCLGSPSWRDENLANEGAVRIPSAAGNSSAVGEEARLLWGRRASDVASAARPASPRTASLAILCRCRWGR